MVHRKIRGFCISELAPNSWILRLTLIFRDINSLVHDYSLVVCFHVAFRSKGSCLQWSQRLLICTIPHYRLIWLLYHSLPVMLSHIQLEMLSLWPYCILPTISIVCILGLVDIASHFGLPVLIISDLRIATVWIRLKLFLTHRTQSTHCKFGTSLLAPLIPKHIFVFALIHGGTGLVTHRRTCFTMWRI